MAYSTSIERGKHYKGNYDPLLDYYLKNGKAYRNTKIKHKLRDPYYRNDMYRYMDGELIGVY